ncbi:MAG: tyrosine-type recombinase/integrase [Alkalibacterium thalassium]|nr:tyrosine-type recombinase/integrase [Alkalibacterium thalassium]
MVLYLKPVSYHTVRQKLKRYLKELKFEKADILSTHALRHTHASRLLLEGATMEYIAEQLGDEMETVEKIYVHVMEQLRRQNKSIVDSMHG